MTENSFAGPNLSPLDVEKIASISNAPIVDRIMIDDFWFQPKTHFDPKMVAQRWEEIRSVPFSKIGRGALCRIVFVLGKAGAQDLWLERESEWFEAMTPKLGRCDTGSIANNFWALSILRKDGNCEIPEAFKANLRPVIDALIDDFSIRDFALTISGMAQENLLPPSDIWEKMCIHCTKLFSDRTLVVTPKDVHQIVYSFSALGKLMPDELKQIVFERAEALDFSTKQMIILAADMARAADTLPSAFENRFYESLSHNWGELKSVDKAQALSAIATLSMLKPLPDGALEFLSGVDTNDTWNEPALIRPRRLGLILQRLFPDAKNADLWKKNRPFTGLNFALREAIKNAGFETRSLEGIDCVVNTSEGPVLVQQTYPDQLVHGLDGDVRLIGKLVLTSAALRDSYPDLPLVHVSLEALPKLSKKQLNKYLVKAAALGGVHQIIVTPGSVCKFLDVKYQQSRPAFSKRPFNTSAVTHLRHAQA